MHRPQVTEGNDPATVNIVISENLLHEVPCRYAGRPIQQRKKGETI
jgi:hypothetical protein